MKSVLSQNKIELTQDQKDFLEQKRKRHTLRNTKNKFKL